MYLRDLARTKGHTSLVTDGHWHPNDRNWFITSSIDSTIRIWDTTSELYGLDRSLKNTYLIKFKDKRGRKIKVTTCRYSPDGNTIVGGADDGSL